MSSCIKNIFHFNILDVSDFPMRQWGRMERIRRWVRETGFKSWLELKLAICNSLNHNFPVGLSFFTLKNRLWVQMAWCENPLYIMFMYLKFLKWAFSILQGGWGESLSLILWKLTSRLKNLPMSLGTPVPAVILHLCINNAFPFVLSRMAIFTCVPWSHLSKVKEVGLGAPTLDKLGCFSISVVQRIQ